MEKKVIRLFIRVHGILAFLLNHAEFTPKVRLQSIFKFLMRFRSGLIYSNTSYWYGFTLFLITQYFLWFQDTTDNIAGSHKIALT